MTTALLTVTGAGKKVQTQKFLANNLKSKSQKWRITLILTYTFLSLCLIARISESDDQW